KREGEVMKAMGCCEAMNLDGGASRSMAHGSSIVVQAGRALTNVIVVYDTSHPAPAPVRTSWRNFQRNRAMIQLIE
ncbi:MAG: phosphodiester glycosidase family protein, partial [Cyanobacteria bacterium]|nr:phosphodiester glycosidase family protein [Cyanobacteriota bacterium]